MSQKREQLINRAETVGRTQARDITNLDSKADTVELKMRVASWANKLAAAKRARTFSEFDVQGFAFNHELATRVLAARQAREKKG